MATLVERVAERIPEFGIKLAYGDPTAVDGQEILPVALVGYGFGAGEGVGAPSAPAGEDDGAPQFSGSGGGGGGVAIPVGAYVRRHGRLVFRPNAFAVLAFGVPAIAALGVAVAAVVKAAR